MKSPTKEQRRRWKANYIAKRGEERYRAERAAYYAKHREQLRAIRRDNGRV